MGSLGGDVFRPGSIGRCQRQVEGCRIVEGASVSAAPMTDGVERRQIQNDIGVGSFEWDRNLRQRLAHRPGDDFALRPAIAA